LIAKLIAYDADRIGAIRVMKRALMEFTIEPLKTTIPLYLRIMDDEAFQRGEFTTEYIRRFIPEEEEEDEE